MGKIDEDENEECRSIKSHKTKPSDQYRQKEDLGDEGGAARDCQGGSDLVGCKAETTKGAFTCCPNGE